MPEETDQDPIFGRPILDPRAELRTVAEMLVRIERRVAGADLEELIVGTDRVAGSYRDEVERERAGREDLELALRTAEQALARAHTILDGQG
jgi:hypothetical protein